MKYLITGGAGFIGSHLVNKILSKDKNAEITVLDNLSSGYLENINEKKVNFIKGDILNINKLINSSTGRDYIFHLAADISVPNSVQNPINTHKINVEGTLNVLEAARQNKIKRVIFSSSSAIYGQVEGSVVEDAEKNPISPYGAQKLEGEILMQNYYRTYGVETVNLRYFNVYGPGQRLGSGYAAVIPIFIHKIINNEKPIVNGNPQISRDFVYVEDVAEANYLACFEEKAVGKSFNIGTSNSITLEKLVETINAQLGKNISFELGDFRNGDITKIDADIKLASNILGFQPATSFLDGIGKTIEFIQM